MTLPSRWGLYDPEQEHDACGIGFVAHIKGDQSHEIVEQGLEVLSRLSHRAACGCDPESGDGAGILLQLPHTFFEREAIRLGFGELRRRRYAVAQVFLSPDRRVRASCEELAEEVVEHEGQEVVGWRDVPTDATQVGPLARSVMPVFRQLFVRLRRLPPTAHERKLYVIRKVIENRIREEGLDPNGYFHVPSFSTETIVYKGLLLPGRLAQFYGDLRDPDLDSAIALVHSRFSTNTMPTWDLAQPFRYIAHNGEINTLRGNRNWMMARRSQLQSAKFGANLERLYPIIVPGKSDSAQFDNMLELLHLGGRTLPHAIMMMIPEAWQSHELMQPERRAFYEYLSCLMEPWDGPAAIAFTDGHVVGATLDRNGLRPARYIITEDDRVILSSESGVLEVPADQIRAKGRLQPGKIFLVDTQEGRILDDEEVKRDLCSRFPYARWLENNVFHFSDFSDVPLPARLAGDELWRLQRAFGYNEESRKIIIEPMATSGKEPVGSMGNDAPLAVLSTQAPRLFEYFHQLFAQVTNPPIDPIREELVMTLETNIGPDGNTFEETPEQCHHLRMKSVILTNQELAKLAALRDGVFEPITLPLTYEIEDKPGTLARALQRLCTLAKEKVEDGYNILILSDRGVDARRAAIPSLLAMSAVHQHLVREGTRLQAGLILETAEAFEVHDFAVLIGFGAAVLNPYLALDSVQELVEQSEGTLDPVKAEENYIAAVNGGLLKIMSKMGISTLHSYRGAQIFEAVGLNQELIDQHFTGTPSRIEGISIDDLEREVLERHERGFGGGELLVAAGELPTGGQYRWRRRGELHKWSPATIGKLQAAVQQNSKELFDEFSRLVDEEGESTITLRGLLDLIPAANPIPLEEVEPASEIVKRFASGAMSFGSISAEAHETLAIAMNRLKGRSNSGEGGEESRRYKRDENGDWRRSAIKQVASGRFGVTTEYLVNADDLQIKVAQGAKPGEGGQLPGHKIDERIAKVRCSVPGVTLISPPPHHDIYSIEDLAQLIYDLQTVNPQARISVKLVSEVGVGTIAAGVVKAHAGCVVIAGDSGGTGASPLSSIKHAGLPWELGLAETQQVLGQNNLRDRVTLQVDGGLRTGRDVIVGALLGAEEFGVATAALIAEGCVMLRKCHLNTCSVGVATQDPELRRRFMGKPEYVVNFFLLLAEDVRRHMATLGVRQLCDLVGRIDLLKQRTVAHWKARKIDLSQMLAKSRVKEGVPCRFVKMQPWGLADHLDRRILKQAPGAIDQIRPTSVSVSVCNTDRAVGTLLSGDIARRHGSKGLPEDTLQVKLKGTAGQSLGAFLASGVTLELEGGANDYVGKGLSGGRIIIYPPATSRFVAAQNVIIGNTVLYGATSGELFVAGIAGERFAVRNSGARAVVEGVGDHACEYMTGGVVAVLGRFGRNFAAGMSGGTAYVFDRERTFRRHCNLMSVELESLVDESDIWMLYGMIEDHVRYTKSALGSRILDNWEHMVSHFVKVMPIEYKQVLQQRRAKRPPARNPTKLAVVAGAK